MSTKLVEDEIRRFLASSEPEATCITGHWGVGKTYAWNKFLQEAKVNGGIALKRYSYVSLFGVNSLDEFKYAIFENTVQSSEIGVAPSLKTLQTNTAAAAEGLGRKFVWFMQQLPVVKNHVGGLGPVWFLSVKNTIVCIDDIERRGKGLSVRDVMGLVSSLKEQKGCKALLILNDEALEDEKQEFQTYYEKVVDTSLRFCPTAEDCVRIALTGETPAGRLLAADCVALGVSNIRVIKKIERAVRKVEPHLGTYNGHILRQAVQSLTLFGWSLFEPGAAPSLEYLTRRHALQYLNLGKKETEVISDKEAAWNALLDVYGFTNADEFDLVLLDGMRNSYFDPDVLKGCASELDRKITAATQENSFEEVWRLYHDSFDNNQDQVLDAIYNSFLLNVRTISPTNLNGTVTLLKELGRSNQALELIGHYVQGRVKSRV